MDLYKIQLDDSALDILGSAGVKTKKQLQRVVQDLGFSARDAFKSKVPIDTGELREDIEVDVAPGEARIYLTASQHHGRRGKPIGIAELVQALQAGEYKGRSLHRTQSSHNIAPYSSVAARTTTAGWITSAKVAFNNSYRKYLRNLSG